MSTVKWREQILDIAAALRSLKINFSRCFSPEQCDRPLASWTDTLRSVYTSKRSYIIKLARVTAPQKKLYSAAFVERDTSYKQPKPQDNTVHSYISLSSRAHIRTHEKIKERVARVRIPQPNSYTDIQNGSYRVSQRGGVVWDGLYGAEYAVSGHRPAPEKVLTF